jgi:hypothetical protein
MTTTSPFFTVTQAWSIENLSFNSFDDKVKKGLCQTNFAHAK